jgi:hypothetical protein
MLLLLVLVLVEGVECRGLELHAGCANPSLLVLTPTYLSMTSPMRGLARPSTEAVQACCAPRVWVWSFWFGFAFCCVALLCGVYVRLHQVLLPAGGPFLPSLSGSLSMTYPNHRCRCVQKGRIPSKRSAHIPWVHGQEHEPRFICDVMLEGLARQMRLFGLDVLSMEQREKRMRPQVVRCVALF